MPTHLFYSNMGRVYMRFIRFILIMVALVMGIVHVQAQEVSMSDLVGKTWKAVSGYDGSENIDWSITFSMESSEHKFIGKSDNKVSRFTYKTYLCPSKPEKYDATLLGKNTKGKYLVFERQFQLSCFLVLLAQIISRYFSQIE